MDPITREQQKRFEDSLCQSAARSMERYNCEHLAPVVEAMVDDSFPFEEPLANAKRRWPWVAFHLRINPNLTEVDELRKWKESAMEQLAKWDAVRTAALACGARLGLDLPTEVVRILGEVAHLRELCGRAASWVKEGGPDDGREFLDISFSCKLIAELEAAAKGEG